MPRRPRPAPGARRRARRPGARRPRPGPARASRRCTSAWPTPWPAARRRAPAAGGRRRRGAGRCARTSPTASRRSTTRRDAGCSTPWPARRGSRWSCRPSSATTAGGRVAARAGRSPGGCRAFRPDPLRRLRLDRLATVPLDATGPDSCASVLGRSSLPPPSPAARAAVDAGHPPARRPGQRRAAAPRGRMPWSAAATRPATGLGDALDRRSSHTPLRARQPRLVAGHGRSAVRCSAPPRWLGCLWLALWPWSAGRSSARDRHADPGHPARCRRCCWWAGCSLGCCSPLVARRLARVGARRRRRVMDAPAARGHRRRWPRTDRRPGQAVLERHRTTATGLGARPGAAERPQAAWSTSRSRAVDASSTGAACGMPVRRRCRRSRRTGATRRRCTRAGGGRTHERDLRDDRRQHGRRPVVRTTQAGGPFATFRIASTRAGGETRAGAVRRQPAPTTSTWWRSRSLAANIVASRCEKGQPVIVYGRLRINQWVSGRTSTRTAVEIEAYNVGHDLTCGQATFAKVGAGPARQQRPAGRPGSRQSLTARPAGTTGTPEPDEDARTPTPTGPTGAATGTPTRRAAGGVDRTSRTPRPTRTRWSSTGSGSVPATGAAAWRRAVAPGHGPHTGRARRSRPRPVPTSAR